MTTTEKSEAPEAATPEASKPIPHSPDQKGLTSMTQTAECRYCTQPVGSGDVCAFCVDYVPPADLAAPGRFEASCPCGSSIVVDGDSEDDDAMIDEWHEAHAQCQPVDLDGQELTAAAARFAALTNDRVICHDGDPEKVIGFPRPQWADPEEDHIGHSAESSYYASAPVWVPASTVTGRNDPDAGELTPASARTAVTQYGDGHVLVSLSLRRWMTTDSGARWAGLVLDFTAAEAAQLAHALMAASDLAAQALVAPAAAWAVR